MFKAGRNYLMYLEDILEAIKKIEKYTRNLNFEEFSSNEMIIDAVIRNFEVIGEASAKIPDHIKERYPHVEWKEAIGFRNILIHDYFGVDVEAVWDTIQKNLPGFRKNIMNVVKGEK
jgi:uncharacterized protein with HEPN domain